MTSRVSCIVPSKATPGLVRISELGERVWDLSFGGSEEEGPTTIVPDGSGGYWISGASTSGISGNKTAPNRGAVDMWVLHVATPRVPTLLAHPQPVTATAGERVTFNVEGRSATVAHRYQWQFNGVDLPGETNRVLRFEKVIPANAGSYRVKLTDRFGVAESRPAALTYTDAPRLGLAASGQFHLFGTPGKRYRIEQADSLTPPLTWIARTSLTMECSPSVWRENSPIQSIRARFYRAALDSR